MSQSPEIFHGSDQEDFEEWIVKFKEYATTNQLTNAKKLQLLKSSMRDNAAKELKKLPIKIKINYDLLVERLRLVYILKGLSSTQQTMITFMEQCEIDNETLIEIQQKVNKIANIEYPKGIKQQWKDNNYIPTKDDIYYINNAGKDFIKNGYLLYNYGIILRKLYESLIGETRIITSWLAVSYMHSYSSFGPLKNNLLRIQDQEQMLYSFQNMCSALSNTMSISDRDTHTDMIELITKKGNEKINEDTNWIDRSMILMGKKYIIHGLLNENRFEEAVTLYREMIDIPCTGYVYADEIIVEAKYNLSVLTDQTDQIYSEEFNWIHNLIKENNSNEITFYDVYTN